MLSLENAKDQISQVPYFSLFCLIQNEGLQGSAELVSLMSEEQLIGCIDLDSWQKDSLQIEKLACWLQLISEASRDKLHAVMATMDPELLTLTFMELAIVTSNNSENYLAADWNKSFLSPDQIFILTVSDQSRVPFLKELLDGLYENSVEEGFQFLSSVELHLKSEILEDAYHLKTARLSDIGFVESAEANSIYRRPLATLEKDRTNRVEVGFETEPPVIFNSLNLPAPLTQTLKSSNLVLEVLNEMGDSLARDIFLQGLVFLANRVVSVWGSDFSSGSQLEHAAQQVMVNLSQGISNLKGDGWTHREIAQIHPSQLFSQGYQQIVLLQKKWMKTKIHDHLVEYQKIGIDLWPENLKKVGNHLNRPIPSLPAYSEETSVSALIGELELFSQCLDFIKSRGYHYLSLARDLLFSETNQSRESIGIDTLTLTLLGSLLLFGEKSIPGILTVDDLDHLLNKMDLGFTLNGVSEKLNQTLQKKLQQLIHEQKLTQKLDPRYIAEFWLWLESEKKNG